MSEQVHNDADDRSTIAATMRRGGLVNELNARHLAYHRAITKLQDRIGDTLLLMEVTATTPDQFRPPDLSHMVRSVREAADVFEAARLALQEYGDND